MKRVFQVIGKTLLWAVIGIAGLLMLVLALLYIPPVQDFATKKALEMINSSGELKIGVGKLRLSFPLKIAVDSASVTAPGIDIYAGRAEADVSLLPLLKGDLRGSRIVVRKARVNLGGPDSAFQMNAALDFARVLDGGYNLLKQDISVDRLLASGADVTIKILPDTVPEPAPTDTVTSPLTIALKHGVLENVRYRMSIEPIITDLEAFMSRAIINGASFDMIPQLIHANDVTIDSIDAKYIYPSAEYMAAHQVAEEPVDSAELASSFPWTVTCDKVRLAGGNALYALDGARPVSNNFDLDYIQASEISIAVDSFLNRGTAVKVPIRSIRARERCGVGLTLTGLFELDSTAMRAQNIALRTGASRVSLNAMMGMNEEKAEKTPLDVNLTADIANEDLRRLAPAPMAEIVEKLPRYQPLLAEVKLNGSMANLNINTIKTEIPEHIGIKADGKIANLTDIDKAVGNLAISGWIADGQWAKPILFDAKSGRGVRIPPLTIDGDAKLDHGVIDGSIAAHTGSGRLALEALWNNRSTAYDIDLRANAFPVQSILPEFGLKDVTASISVSGQGLDVMSPKTDIDAKIDLVKATYMGHQYQNVTLTANLAAGHAAIEALSRNPYAAFDIKADGDIAALPYRLNFDGDITNLDFKALGLTDSATTVSAKINGMVSFDPATKTQPMMAGADIDIASLNYRAGDMKVNARDIALKFNADTTHTNATLTNHDLALDFNAGMNLDSLLSRFDATSALLDRCVKRQRLAVDSLQRTLPPFTLNFSAGQNNVLGSVLNDYNMAFRSASLTASNDSLISLDANVLKFRTGTTRLDTITFNVRQHGTYLTYDANIDNAPGTLDAFAKIAANGYISASRIALIFKQQNLQGETGYSFGSLINMHDSTTVALRFVPYHPVIGYKDWEINRDNIITYNLLTNHIDANLYLHNDVSSLKLFTNHTEGTDSTQEAITLQLSDIKLQDWLAINPFAPAMKGDLSADMSFSWSDKSLDGAGTLTLADFTYGKQRVGTFAIDTKVQTSAGIVRASADMFIDGRKSLTLNGNLNDTTKASPFLLDMRVIHLPLQIANPFLGADVAKLSGTLNGVMDVTGDMSSPILNGWLQFDSASVMVPMLGSRFKFSDGKIPVDSSVVRFNDYTIKGLNKNGLFITGSADISNFANILLDLSMHARDMQIVNGKKSLRGANVYGKAFIDLDANVKGSTSFLNVDAALKVLPGTNVTYVMPDAVNTISSHSDENMVRFVNFADTAAVAAADSVNNSGMLLNLDASLTVSSGTTLGVDLSADGKDRVQIQGEGTINYTLDYLGDERTTGRLNINQGYARYSPPMISEKDFTFREGSYVAFNGDMLNPVLNIHADDDLRANVNSSGNSRMVTFDIILNVSGTLEEMNASFDLTCNDDITIENELKSMTAEQRANQAMNLMITGTYSGANTKTVSGSATSSLYSFLESQINSWAASTIKGVDLSFGINQYEKTVDGAQTQAMTYSYRVSKSLFDDRFKIVVGGNYTTDAQADENFAENLIADISFEYMLNKQGTMYVRLFRHTGYESILEGEITQTGVGFVYKRKLHRLSDMFRFMRRRNSAPQLPIEAPTTLPSADVANKPVTTTLTEKEK